MILDDKCQAGLYVTHRRGLARRLVAQRGVCFLVWIGQLGNLRGTVDNRCRKPEAR